MVIDFHTHTFPERIAKAATTKLENFSKWKAVGDGTKEDLIVQMDEAQVDVSVVAPVATSKNQVVSINKNLIKTDRIFTLGAMHPDFMEFRNELDLLRQNGFNGIKLHPDYQNFRVDDKKLFELYEELQFKDMFVLFHAGLDIGLMPPYGACPDMLKVVASNFPKLKIIGAHFGGFDMWEDVLEHLAGLSNVWFDTALCEGIMSDYIFYKILNKHGHERILMATDWPWKGVKDTIDWLEQKKLNPNKLDAILGENAKTLLNIH